MSLLTPKEAAAKLKVSPRLVYSLAAKGQLKAVRVGTLKRFTEEELDRFIQGGGCPSGEISVGGSMMRQRAEKAEARVRELDGAITQAIDWIGDSQPSGALRILRAALQAGKPDET